MADKKIKGIIIEIGGDTIGLNKALEDSNKTIRDTQGELSQINKLLKFDPANTELLAQKQKLLGSALVDNRTKLDALKQAQVQAAAAFERGEIAEESMRAINREVVKVTQEVGRLEQQLASSETAFDKFAAASQKVGENTEKLGRAMAPVSAAAGAMVGGMAAMAVKAGQTADDLNTLSKQTGLSTEQIQKFQFASDRIDVSLDVLTGSMAKLTRNMSSASDGTGAASSAFKELGVRIVNTDGSLRNNQDVFNDTITALGKISNETQRDAYAMEIFGKSAQDLNPLILGGAEALERMGKEAEAMGLILSQDTLDQMNEFADEIDEMKAVVNGAFTAIGGQLAEAFLPLAKSIAEALSKVAEVLGSLDSNTLGFIAAIAGVIAITAPTLIAIGKISMGVSALGKAFKWFAADGIGSVKKAIEGIGTAMTWLAANPAVLIAAAIAAIVIAIIYLWNTNEDFRNAIIGIWESIKDMFSKVCDFIVGIFTKTIPAAWESLKTIGRAFGELIADLIKAPINAALSIVNVVIAAVNKAIQWLNNLKLPDFLGGGNLGISIKMLPELPMLAMGGILRAGSAIVGERGPELLSVTGGRAIVQPLSGAGSGLTSAKAGQVTYVTNHNRIDASSLREVAEMKQMLDGERISMRQGYVGG